MSLRTRSSAALLGLMLLACSAEEPADPAPPPAEEPAPAEVAPPNITGLTTKAPATGRVGEELSFETAWEMPNACWYPREVLSEPETNHFVLTVEHVRQGDMCTQAIKSHSGTTSYTPTIAGEGSFTLIIDGKERARQDFVIAEAEPPVPVPG